MGIEMIGKQIALMRKERGVKQEELATFVGVSTQAVSKWENGGAPDAELLPKIADFFSVSIDSLFERSITDYSDLRSALINKIKETPEEQRIKLVFNYCWDMERALMPSGFALKNDSIEDYEKEIGETEQHYSSMLRDDGFTLMGIANRSQYFLIVPNAKNPDTAYLDGVDYTSFFKDFSDKDLFNTCVFLNKREASKFFTANLLVKNLKIEPQKANDILNTLMKYRLVYSKQIEMDDEIQTVYHFWPSASFIGLLIFATEIICRPQRYTYNCQSRKKPYLA